MHRLGGTDLITNILQLYKPGVDISTSLVIIDVFIITLNVIFLQEIDIALYSFISIYIVGKIIDVFFEGINFAKMLYIVSDKAIEISNRINEEIKRGTTGIYGKGMYEKEDKLILLCVIGRKQIPDVKKITEEVDKKAFIIISDAREVVGKGFKIEK